MRANVVGGQPVTASLDAILDRALHANPSIQAAAERLEAARRRANSAGTRPDPMIMAGIENFALGREAQAAAHGASGVGGPEPMTMRVIGVSQTIPYPGKIRLRTQAAQKEAEASEAALDVVRRTVVRDVKDAYYQLAFIDQAQAVTRRSADVLGTFIQVTEGRYSVGVAGQQDVLKARVEAARLAETAAALEEQRRAALARLNEILDRPSDTDIDSATIPAVVRRAAIGDSAREVRFVSAALGARVADSPLRSLTELQQMAIQQSPELREHEAMIAAQAARAALARKDVLPDFDVSLQYGQRSGLPDMVTATIAMPFRLQRKRKQDQQVAEADAQLAALHEEHRAKVNAIRSEVARLVSELERERSQLALYAKAILPQGRAALTSATESYQVGKVEFLTVLDSQSTVFGYEMDYYRALADFARNLAELERVVGGEVLR
jgi:outer membrane protein, heavy metal efflux system